MNTSLNETIQDEVSKKKIVNPIDLETNWYVFYTCPRAEKVAYQELIYRSYEVFCHQLPEH